MSEIAIVRNYNGSEDNLLSMHDEVLRVDWVNLGEGCSGDYDPEDPNDVNLLRFDVYKQEQPEHWDDSDDGWRAVDDASYCTNMPAHTSEDILKQALSHIFEEYRAVIEAYPGHSVKKLGERLSHISPENLKP